MTNNGHNFNLDRLPGSEPEVSEEEHGRRLAEIVEYNKRILVKALGSIYSSLPVFALDMPGVTIGGARSNAKHPAYLVISVPDELVVNQRGPAEERDLVLLVHIPRSTQRKLDGTDEALIHLP